MEDSATITESLLLSKLQSSSDLSSIRHLFSSYLHPFSAIINKPKYSETNSQTSTIIRSLAKKFISFLCNALYLIPKRLDQIPQIESSYAWELFESYKLCLSCLESVSSVLSGNPHSVQFRRTRLMRCYERWGRYEDAQNEGFLVLEFLGNLYGENLKRGVIPELRKENGDKVVAELILEVAVTNARCVFNRRSKDKEDYRRLLSMADEIQPWLRVVDVDAYEKLHKELVTCMNKCTLFLVGELASFDEGLVHSFCVLTFSGFTKSSMKDQMDKNGKEKSLVDFLELVDFCANKCQNAIVGFCGAVTTHFNKLAAKFSQVNFSPVDLIVRLYAITLSITDLKARNDISIPKILLNMENQLQSLTTTHGSLTCQSEISAEVLGLYFNALRFLCGSLSKMIIYEHKDILCGLEDVSFFMKLPNVQDAFYHFLSYRSSERERDVDEGSMRIILTVAVAAFTLSFVTKKNLKESTAFLRHLILADWVKATDMKFLFVTLYNVGMVLYRTNRRKEATKSFKLCCKAACNCVLLICKMYTSSGDGFSSVLSEDAVAGFVTLACEKSSHLLDVLHQCGSNKISKILTDYLGRWSIAHSFFDKIPCPVALIKQWVKIECKQIKDHKAEHAVPTIYSLLMSSSSKISKETFAILLEQELQAYKEMKSLNPTLCKTMQMTITNILFEKIYNTKDSCLQKSRILLANARESRANGVEGLNDCIKYLSESISIMSDYKSTDGGGQVCHLLAEAYCLRALCTQEAEPYSKNFIEDVGIALKLWLSQEHSQSTEQIQTALTLLYYVADLLSLKGYMENHCDIYETMIRLYTWKNIPMQEWLTLLWQSRSLCHALCASPVSDVFIITFSNHCNLSKSMEFWTSCMKKSKSLEVGFRQSFSVLSTLSSPDSYKHNHATQSHITIDEVKQAASDLINSVPPSDSSLLLAAHLYYDLSERLVAKGLMIEALYYANEAHRLRAQLFQKSFMHPIEPINYTVDADGEAIQKRKYSLKTFCMHPSMATGAWSYDKKSGDSHDCIVTPWNVLRVYLESTLQTGTIQEIVGNGSEAKSHLLWGKLISSFQDLPIFVVGFSCGLGKLYHGQQLWDLAQRELESAKHILADSHSLISCSKCRLGLEVTVDQQLGDLYRSRFKNLTFGNKLLEDLSKAETLYRSATDKLKVFEWKNCVSDSEEASAMHTMFCDALLIGGQTKIHPKVVRKSKKTVKPLPEQRVTSRITRSSKQRGEYAQNEVTGKWPQKVATCGCEVTCVSYEVKCWHCIPSEIMKSKSLTNIIQIKWECTRRRLLLRLLTGIGKCLGVRDEIHRAHEVLLESISVLVSRSTFCPSRLSISNAFLAELIAKNVTGDIFAVEHASILYNICWFSLKNFCDKGTRNEGCDMLVLPIPILVSGLKLSFILCREVPLLFQKVSRLLVVLYTLSSSNKAFSMSSSGNVLCESQWASYFHQASLGTHYNHQLFSHIGKQKGQNASDFDVSHFPSSLSLLKLVPESVLDLEEFISKFFGGLPCATIICISMLGNDFAGLLRELLPFNPPTHAWIILSRLNSDSLPVVILLPISSILAGSSEDNEDPSSSFIFNKKSCVKSWTCPWGNTIIDDVAPFFKTILEENYISASSLSDNIKKNDSLWWSCRYKLDRWLGDFLRDVEDLWFGPWKHLLLGECSESKQLDFVQKKLISDLKSECKVDVHESILKMIIGGFGHGSHQKECLSEIISKKGCYVGGIKCDNDESPVAHSSKQDGIDSSSLVSQLILNAIREVGEEDLVDREPVILVLDSEIQMLPWENLPILRNQEVYRMPSVASISSTFERCCQSQKKDSALFPMIDPLDAYYLLNPDGDLPSTEAEFGNWFKDLNLEGTTGTSPTVDKLSVVLKNHDLFMYFGHSSGVQYIRGDEIQKLNKCAATLLMGCSSGSLSLNGSYTPKGAPLYYLFAGSPVIVANLWEVTDKDIDRFGRALLEAWIKTRSSSLADCTQCSEISDKLKKLNMNEDKRKGKKKILRENSVEFCEVNNSCKHKPKIGSFMGQARQACKLPFLIGASPVCYGVPTCIKNKDL